MPMTKNGISTTATGVEQYEHFPAPLRTQTGPKMYCQHDYRHTDGTLFSCVAPTLEQAQAKRDLWLAAKAA